MKNKSLLWIIIAIALLLLAAGWILTRKAPAPAPSPIQPVNVSTPEAVVLPKVITLYQKGDGESDLAVFVAKEMAKKYNKLALFRLVNVLDEPQLAEYFGVSSVPSVVFVLPSGRVYKKYGGYLDQAKIVKILQSIKKD